MTTQLTQRPRGIVARPLGDACTTDTLRVDAYEFVVLHYRDDGRPWAAAECNHLMERAVAFLMQRAPISQRRAETIAAQAICEYQCHEAKVSIDVDSSTAFCVVVVDRATNKRRAVSAFEIAELLTDRALATALAAASH